MSQKDHSSAYSDSWYINDVRNRKWKKRIYENFLLRLILIIHILRCANYHFIYEVCEQIRWVATTQWSFHSREYWQKTNPAPLPEESVRPHLLSIEH